MQRGCLQHRGTDMCAMNRNAACRPHAHPGFPVAVMNDLPRQFIILFACDKLLPHSMSERAMRRSVWLTGTPASACCRTGAS